MAYDRDAYFDSWIQSFAGVPSSCRFKTTIVTRDLNTPPLIPDGPICLQRRTHVIEDLDKPAVILEVRRSKKNFKYAFVCEFKDGLKTECHRIRQQTGDRPGLGRDNGIYI